MIDRKTALPVWVRVRQAKDCPNPLATEADVDCNHERDAGELCYVLTGAKITAVTLVYVNPKDADALQKAGAVLDEADVPELDRTWAQMMPAIAASITDAAAFIGSQAAVSVTAKKILTVQCVGFGLPTSNAHKIVADNDLPTDAGADGQDSEILSARAAYYARLGPAQALEALADDVVANKITEAEALAIAGDLGARQK